MLDSIERLTSLELVDAYVLVFSVFIYGWMLVVSSVCLRLKAVSKLVMADTRRYGSIDGLRGALATGVFLHHIYLGRQFFLTGEWEFTGGSLVYELGHSTVALFFMITGFLFTIKAMKPDMDWRHFATSRVARLTPLYFFVVLFVCACVFHASSWKLQEPSTQVALEVGKWLAFVCFGRPDINAFPHTWSIIAGVNWTLQYEVSFYVIGVPGIYLLSRILHDDRKFLFVSFALFAGTLALRVARGAEFGNSLYTCHFLGGIVAGAAYKTGLLKKLVSGAFARLVSAVSFLYLLSTTNSVGPAALLCTVVIFAAVVGGASFFGLLQTRSAIWLGEISYGVYLLHGAVLWVLFSILRRNQDMSLVGTAGWLAFFWVASTAVVIVSSLSFVLLERPAMRRFARRQSPPSVAMTPAQIG